MLPDGVKRLKDSFPDHSTETLYAWGYGRNVVFGFILGRGTSLEDPKVAMKDRRRPSKMSKLGKTGLGSSVSHLPSQLPHWVSLP